MQLLDKLLAKLGHNLGLPSEYRLLKKLGEGAEGEVWLCLNDESQSLVAIKLVSRGAPPHKLDMARREFRMLAHLGPGHLNIVRPLEVVLTSKHLAVVTEYVSGGSLSDHLAKHAVPEDVARYFFKQILSAVAFCHSRKIVYRDLKPANVLITGTSPPFLKLCDFGLADSWEGRQQPMFKSLVGTPGYMAPEIMSSFFTGAAELKRRSATDHTAAVNAAKQALQAATAAAPAAAAAAPAAAAPRTAFAAAAAVVAPDAAAEHAAEAAADAAAAFDSPTGTAKARQMELRPSASGKLTSAVAAAAAAAVKAAAAAHKTSGSLEGGSGGVAALAAVAAAADPEAEAELQQAASYDGQRADVFGLGVLLVVIMMRRMPWNYDDYAETLPLLKAMQAFHDLAVVHRVSWRDATPGANSLSPSLAALLDMMLEVDPAQRATLEQVAASEWVNGPLPVKLQCALEVIDEQQQLREQRYKTAVEAAAAAAAAGCADFRSSCTPEEEDEDTTAAAAAAAAAAAEAASVPPEVQQQLDAMIEAAKTVGKGFKLESRLNLTQLPHQQRQAAAQQAQQAQEKQQKQRLRRQSQQPTTVTKAPGVGLRWRSCGAVPTPAASGAAAAAAGVAPLRRASDKATAAEVPAVQVA